jgi:pimeloyl-ACP methyl ester carboxylesterase
MTLVEVERGVTIHAQVVGDGPPVVLLHGWGFDHRVWDRQVRVLAEAGRTVVCIDLRGHGRSDRPFGDYSINRLARDVVGVIDALELDRVALVGWSLGGLTAFRVAVDAEDRITRLVLVGSNGVATCRQDGFPFGFPSDTYEAALVAAELADRVGARRALLSNSFAAAPNDELIAHLVYLTLETPSWAGAAALRTLLRANQVADAGRLAVPTVQIIGEEDPVFSRPGAAWLAEHVSKLRQVIVSGCGHFPMVEAPAEFDRTLLAAVGDVS